VDGGTQAIAALETLEGAFQDCSKGKDYFGGDKAGIVDIVVGGYLAWFNVFEKMIGVRVMDAERTPLLAAWADRFRALDAARGILLEDVDKVLDFLKAFFA
jgi:glutathione S-transferase